MAKGEITESERGFVGEVHGAYAPRLRVFLPCLIPNIIGN